VRRQGLEPRTRGLGAQTRRCRRVSYCAGPGHIVPVHADQPAAYRPDGATWCQSVSELPSTDRSHQRRAPIPATTTVRNLSRSAHNSDAARTAQAHRFSTRLLDTICSRRLIVALLGAPQLCGTSTPQALAPGKLPFTRQFSHCSSLGEKARVATQRFHSSSRPKITGCSRPIRQRRQYLLTVNRRRQEKATT
jgi:hypothetical protein